MIVSTSLDNGQVTFIIRIVIQILSYSGLAIIGMLILGSVPRVASVHTHDIVNQVVGTSTSTSFIMRWLFHYARRGSSGPTLPTFLVLILSLSLFYNIFVSLADIGFLGFYQCSIPGPTLFDTPASINSTDSAMLLNRFNTIGGADFSQVEIYRCDASTTIKLKSGKTKDYCTIWKRTSLADASFYAGLNYTDTDVLMPLQLSHFPPPSSDDFIDSIIGDIVDYNNTFHIGFSTQLVTQPVIQSGFAIEPLSTGVRIVVGVPQLQSNTKVELSMALAFEVDVGCMNLGVISIENESRNSSTAFGDSDAGKDYMSTNGTWRKYTGPDYMKDVLTKTVDDTRRYLHPFFNQSTLDSSGTVTSINKSTTIFLPYAQVAKYSLPFRYPFHPPDSDLIQNCTFALQQKLGIDSHTEVEMCSYLGIGGIRYENTKRLEVFEWMVCSASAQVNMVSATIQANSMRNISIELSRLPSVLTSSAADVLNPNGLTIASYSIPYKRYTLSSESNSATSHFIPQAKLPSCENCRGYGSGGAAIYYMVDTLMTRLEFDVGTSDNDFQGLTTLVEGTDQVNTGTDRLAEWLGQIGGSYVLGSLSYNGWAALQATPLKVVSTGGHLGSCYNPYFALAFLPLALSAFLVMFSTVFLLFTGSLSGTGRVKDAYRGLRTYSATLCPELPPLETVLTWKKAPDLHLELLSDGDPVIGDAKPTALMYTKAADPHSSDIANA